MTDFRAEAMGLKAAVYKVQNSNGNWARKGMVFSDRGGGKAWNGRGPLKLAMRCRCDTGRTSYNPLTQRFEANPPYEQILSETAAREGWKILEFTDAGTRWLTLEEFFAL